MIEHTEWARLIQLEPAQGEQARTVAASSNQASRELAARRSAAEPAAESAAAELPAVTCGEATVSHLAKLAGLHAAGALTDAEFAHAKSKPRGRAVALATPRRPSTLA